MGKSNALNCKLLGMGKTPSHFLILCSFELLIVWCKHMLGGALGCGEAGILSWNMYVVIGSLFIPACHTCSCGHNLFCQWMLKAWSSEEVWILEEWVSLPWSGLWCSTPEMDSVFRVLRWWVHQEVKPFYHRRAKVWRSGLCVQVLCCWLGDVSLKGTNILVQMFLSHSSKSWVIPGSALLPKGEKDLNHR